MFDTHVTVVGNLVAEPRLAFTKDGQAVTSFRLAATPRRFDRVAGEWRDGETLFTNVTCWRALAENVAASLKKGSAAIVMGRLSVRPYETRDGAQRQSVEIDALAVGSELGRAITIVKRAERGVVASGAAGRRDRRRRDRRCRPRSRRRRRDRRWLRARQRTRSDGCARRMVGGGRVEQRRRAHL